MTAIEIRYGHIEKVTENEDGSLAIDTGICPFCEKAGEPVLIPARFALAFAEWQNGAFIQQALPMLDADEREQLLSGIHGKCYDEYYPDEE